MHTMHAIRMTLSAEVRTLLISCGPSVAQSLLAPRLPALEFIRIHRIGFAGECHHPN
jgi:hypothetical protein